MKPDLDVTVHLSSETEEQKEENKDTEHSQHENQHFSSHEYIELKTIIDKELESDVKIDQNYGLDLKLNYPNHRRLFESLSQAKIPCIRRISLNYIE